MRRLPIFLVLDVSESMAGKAIDDVQSGIKMLTDALMSDPFAMETVYISVIAFAGKAKTITPLTYVMDFINKLNTILQEKSNNYSILTVLPLKYKTNHNEKIITIPIGYADGFTRMQNNPKVYVKGKAFNVVGRICMDQCMVKIDEDIDIKVGDEVIIFGEDNKNIELIANDLGTINYEVLCMISRRVDRVYMEKDAILQVDSYLIKY